MRGGRAAVRHERMQGKKLGRLVVKGGFVGWYSDEICAEQ